MASSKPIEQISAITNRVLPRAVTCSKRPPTSPPRARTILRDRGVGYIDTTGNVRIEASTPGLFISADGVDRDPWPRDHKLQSLRGRGAARAVRAIVDTIPPYGVRELAQATSVSAPTLSRVLDLLEREAIVTRVRGAVSAVDWQGAIRRWTEDYDQTESNTSTVALEPRGLTALEKKLRTTKLRYVATGGVRGPAIRSNRARKTGGHLRHRRGRVHRPSGSPRDRSRRQRGDSRAFRPRRLRSGGRPRRPSLRRSPASSPQTF